MIYKYNGDVLMGEFTIGDINYPSNWIELSTADERSELGITEEEPVKMTKKEIDAIVKNIFKR